MKVPEIKPKSSARTHALTCQAIPPVLINKLKNDRMEAVYIYNVPEFRNKEAQEFAVSLGYKGNPLKKQTLHSWLHIYFSSL